MIILFLINFVKFSKCFLLTFLVAKFWYPEFVSSYAWHVTEIGGSESGIEIIFAPNKFEILKKFYCLLFY